MRKLVLLEHVSLDGFVAGPDGAMDWIRVDDALFDYVHSIFATADTALFGRRTYEMMAGYWPTAADAPTASRHDVEHGRWINSATKLVVSTTLDAAPWGVAGQAQIVRDNVAETLRAIKQQPGQDLVLIGSASLARACMAQGLIDEYRLNLNPVILGGGTPLFPPLEAGAQLCLVGSRAFDSGVLALTYRAT